jgi:hypothetical protein
VKQHLQQLLDELRSADNRCKGFVTFYHSAAAGSWSQCGSCKHKHFDGDPEYKAVLDAAQSTGKIQQCAQERTTTIPARVKLLEQIVVALCEGDGNGKAE